MGLSLDLLGPLVALGIDVTRVGSHRVLGTLGGHLEGSLCAEDKGLWGWAGPGWGEDRSLSIGCITLWPFCRGFPSAKIVQIKCG